MVDVVSRIVHHPDEQASHSNWCICVWVCERERKSKKEQLVHGGKEAFNLKKWSFQKDAFKWMLTFLETKRLSKTFQALLPLLWLTSYIQEAKKKKKMTTKKKGRKHHVMWATSIPERIWKANPFPLWRLLSKQDLKTRPEPFLTRDLDSIAHHFLPLLLLSFWVYFHLEGERKIFLCKQNLRWWEIQKYVETQSIR